MAIRDATREATRDAARSQLLAQREVDVWPYARGHIGPALMQRLEATRDMIDEMVEGPPVIDRTNDIADRASGTEHLLY